MSRDLEEWHGATDNTSIPPRVKIRVFSAYGGRCDICTLQIAGKLRPAYDHTISLINGGNNCESNLRLLCSPCHREKTRADVSEKSMVARKRAKHIGLKKPRTIRSWRRFNGEIVYATRER